MKTIGITGGVGAGKSEILNYIDKNYNCKIVLADKLAYELESPGNECFEQIVDVIGSECLDRDGFIDKKKMAALIFSDPKILDKVNGILHPAVKKYVLNLINSINDQYDYFFLEAALLIEEEYDKILDELWYIRADAEVRRKRLKDSRGYSDEKIDSIFESQLSDEVFLKHCKTVIDNNGNLTETYNQIDAALAVSI